MQKGTADNARDTELCYRYVTQRSEVSLLWEKSNSFKDTWCIIMPQF